MDMMMMYFHVGTSETVLFKFWKVTDVPSLIWSMAIVFLVAVVYEGIKYFRDSLYARSSIAAATVHSSGSGSNASTSKLAAHTGSQSWGSAVCSLTHLLQTVLHAIQFFISYLLMLVFMTYNVWLCLAVILGAACGYFLFGWKKQSAVEITEHCA